METETNSAIDNDNTMETNEVGASYIIGGVDMSDDADTATICNRDIIDKSSQDVEMLLSKHSVLLSHSLRIGVYWMSIGILYWFLHCMRWYIWILYARSLGQYNHATIAISVYTLYFIQAISCLFWAWISDKYRYDIFGILLSVVAVIGLIMESFAFNYSILLFGTIIVNVFRGLGPISLAFVAKFLPHHNAVKYTSFRFAFIGLSNLIGPAVGGAMTHLLGIKSVFYFCTIISILSLIFMVFFVNGHEKKIHSQQIEMKQLYDTLKNGNNLSDVLIINVDHQFPVSTEKYLLQTKKEKTALNSMCATLTRYEWFMLINIIIANACTIGIEGAFSIYYVVFCLDLYNISVIHSTTMISIMAICYIIGCVSVPPIISKYKNKNNFNVQFIALIINGVFMIILVVMSKYLLLMIGRSWLWIYSIASGLELGIMHMLQESVLLAIQPKQHSGKISGSKVFARNIMKAFLSLIVGVLWSSDIYWFLYGQVAFYMIGLICIILMVIASSLHHSQNKAL